MCGRGHLPFQKQEKTEHQRVHRQFGLRQVCFFLLFSSRVTSTSTRRYEVSGLDPGTPVSLDVRECVGVVCGQVKASKYALCKSEMYTQKERKRERVSKAAREQRSKGVRD